MASTKPRDYIIGIIIFSLFIVGGVSMLGIFNEASPGLTNESRAFNNFSGQFNKLDDVTSEVNTLETSITNADTDYGIFGVLNSLIRSSWNTLTLMFSSFSFMSSVWAGTSYIFGIPVWVAGLIGLLVTVLFAFAIFSAIFQRDI